MEFITSRVVVVICGIVLLAAVAVPVAGMYEGRENHDLDRVADKTSMMIDSFWESDADTMTLRGCDILPSPDCSLEIDGHHIRLMKNGIAHYSLISHASDAVTLSYSGTVTFERGEGRMIVAYH